MIRVEKMVEKTTEKIVETHIESVRKEFTEIVSSMKESLTVLTKKIEQESKDRKAADTKIIEMRRELILLVQELKEKSTSDTQEVGSLKEMISVVRESVRTETIARERTASELVEIRGAMQVIWKKA